MVKIFDHTNKQWLEPIAIYFGKDNLIWRVEANIPGEDPISDGWYMFKNEDLCKISIIGEINHNIELLNDK